MKKTICETIGTFFLVLTVLLVVKSGNPNGAFAIAIVLSSMIYAGGHISGAHYNPAVSFSFFTKRFFSIIDFASYAVYQVLGALFAVCAANILLTNTPDTSSTIIFNSSTYLSILLSEFIFTFALTYVIFNVATAKKNEGNSFYGIAIGGVILAAALSVGEISGAVLNPAVSIALYFNKVLSCSALCSYILVQLIAGAVASWTFTALNNTK